MEKEVPLYECNLRGGGGGEGRVPTIFKLKYFTGELMEIQKTVNIDDEERD